MVTISCSGKLHAFALAEQLERKHLLNRLYTTYAYQKNVSFRKLAKRIDKEDIPVDKIETIVLLAIPSKLIPSKSHTWNIIFDKWVASKVKKSDSRVFVGWSGMSLNAIRAAKNKGMKTIVERGSSHILNQDKVLKEEYKRFGIDFSINKAVIEKELKEYEEADFISVPSFYVKKSFLDYGIKEDKIVMNPYGVGSFFKPADNLQQKPGKKFTIVYVGSLSIRKGLIYLFQALNMLDLPENCYEVWFIGKVDNLLEDAIRKYKRTNWKFFGHINFYELQQYLVQCDVAVHPSLEEGLSMVIPQLMSCGVPVIITPNTGGENIIKDGENGFVVPVRSPESIANKITYLYNQPEELERLKKVVVQSVNNGFIWNDYGDRYAAFLQKIVNEY